MPVLSEADLSLPARLWVYQQERFPLFKSLVLLTAFSSASINFSALLSGRPLPGTATYVVALVVTLILFFQMRACDELKDVEDDRRFRPERPIPRGLVSLRLILGVALLLGPPAAVAAGSLSPGLLLLLLAVWGWLGLMTVEFFAPNWLKARPFVYLVSHMLIMPLIDLFVTATEWLPAAGGAPPGLWLFLLLSFINGCVLEIGRKLYARDNERPGVETYTALLGVRRAATLWGLCLLASGLMLVAVGYRVGAPAAVTAIAAAALAVALTVAYRFAREPTPVWQARVDALSGVWVLLCYLAAGYVPLFTRGGA
jgi:4-hydroxybenzoate polyprenyltransferase